MAQQEGNHSLCSKIQAIVHTSNPIKEFMSAMTSGKADSIIGPVVPLAKNDGLAAVAYVRRNADNYKVNPNRIGFMGFSAGGALTMSVAYNAADESIPNFIAPIYAWNKGIIGTTVSTQKMPAFIVVASDDQLQLAPTSIEIYNKWIAAKQQAELHLYQNGGHGFGMNKQGKSSDFWIESFENWLKTNGLL
jgi:acetyl esterase/lipase